LAIKNLPWIDLQSESKARFPPGLPITHNLAQQRTGKAGF
jgi:hypothetical protein